MSGGAQTHLDNHLVEGPHYARSGTRYGHWVSIASPCYQIVIWGPKCVLAWSIFFLRKDEKAGSSQGQIRRKKKKVLACNNNNLDAHILLGKREHPPTIERRPIKLLWQKWRAPKVLKYKIDLNMGYWVELFNMWMNFAVDQGSREDFKHVDLLKVFRLFRLEWIFLVFRV
jgi:hypothetical protein